MTEEELRNAIQAWNPKGGVLAGEDDLTQQLRDLTVAADPEDWVQARTALRFGMRYFRWLVANGHSTDPGTCFERRLVAAHMADLYPRPETPEGTQRAASRSIGHLDPTVGFKQHLPKATFASLQPRQDKPALVFDAEPLDDAVETVLARYVPGRLAADRWKLVAPLVRDVVRRSAPTSATRAEYLVRLVAYLAAWCDLKGLPLRADVVLAARSIEDFLDWRSRSKNPPKSRGLATYASYLHSLRELFGLPLDVSRREFEKASVGTAYDDFEVKRLFQYATAVRNAERRRSCRAALDLAFGVGAKAAEAGLVRPADVVEDRRGVVVRLHSPEMTRAGRADNTDMTLVDLYASCRVREVIALPAYAQALLADRDAAVAAGATWLIGGKPEGRRERWTRLLRGAPTTGIRIDISSPRAVRTWRLAWLRQTAEALGGFRALRALIADADIAACIDEHFAAELDAEGDVDEVMDLPEASDAEEAA